MHPTIRNWSSQTIAFDLHNKRKRRVK
uniref:Uncharacterized protein n=1 Tax=Rhizophora mucronata TaxID=61149 RepID=A0A2P2PBL2_RHIMU